MIEQQFLVTEGSLGITLELDPAIVGQRDSYRLLQVTDCHLGETEGERLAGMDTDQSLDLVLDLIATEQREKSAADLILATGDLANHESAAAYRRLQRKLNALKTPSAWLPGNHDSYQLMRDTVGEVQVPRVVVLGHWHVFLLDTAVPGRVGGRVGSRQLDALARQLEVTPDNAHIIVALHHQPLAIGSEWLDEQRVEDGEALLDVLAGDSRVKLVLWGHIHQEFETSDSRIPQARMIATPSTCIQFAPQTEDFKLHNNAPGYRWVELNADGSLDTGVERLQGVLLEQDLQSSGY